MEAIKPDGLIAALIKAERERPVQPEGRATKALRVRGALLVPSKSAKVTMKL